MPKTKIEYVEESWNPIESVEKGESGHGYHCTKVSEGCVNCWAEVMNNRVGNRKPFDKRTTNYEIVESKLTEPLKKKKPTIYAVQYMGDLFHKDIPFELVARVFDVMLEAKQHIFLLLTKRPINMLSLIMTYRVSRWVEASIFKNILPGVSVENQKTADLRIPYLMLAPGMDIWVSVEPMLGEINLREIKIDFYPFHYASFMVTPRKVGWIVAGGESGHGARPMHPHWVSSLQNQCNETNTPFFFKQWGSYVPDELGDTVVYADGKTVERFEYIGGKAGFDNGAVAMSRVGKNKAGAILDGKEYREFPKCFEEHFKQYNK